MPGIISEVPESLGHATLGSVGQLPNLPDDDQRDWSKALIPSFLALLKTANYSEEEQLGYLDWFCKWIVPAMGPSLHSAKRSKTKSMATADGSPIEWSIKWTEEKIR